MEVRDKLNTAEKYQSLIDMKRAFISEELKDLGELEQEKILGHPVGKSSVRCPLKPSDSIPLCPNNPAH